MQFNVKTLTFQLSINKSVIGRLSIFLEKHANLLLVIFLTSISSASFYYFYANKLGVAYNDARSHLDIGRRVVENLKPGFAQLGSVWLPLPHLLMTLTVWNDFMWHSGLSGANGGAGAIPIPTAQNRASSFQQ